MKKYIYELNGYLNALAKMIGSECAFGSIVSSEETDIEKEIQQKILCHDNNVNFSVISYPLLRETIGGIVGLLGSKIGEGNSKYIEDLSCRIMDDINEYCGLFSTSINNEGIFYPLRKNTIVGCNYVNGDGFAMCFCFYVKIEGWYVVTYFKCRKEGVQNSASAVTG